MDTLSAELLAALQNMVTWAEETEEIEHAQFGCDDPNCIMCRARDGIEKAKEMQNIKKEATMEGANGAVQCAMHMTDGLVSGNDLKQVLAVWDRGCIELFQELGQYADLCEQCYQEGYTKYGGDFPGVFDYEVSYEFGQWYGKTILEEGGAPSRIEAEAKLRELTVAFFTQGPAPSPKDTYDVRVSRTTTKTLVFEVEAGSEDEAGSKALDMAGDRDFNDGSESSPEYTVEDVRKQGVMGVSHE